MIRIGFIGCGGIAREYLSRLNEMRERAQVVAVCDLDANRAIDLANATGAKVYGDWREMLNSERLDAVFDNLPPFARSDELIEAAQRGLHIFTTKPLALDMETARRSCETIEQAEIICSVGYMFRYSGITNRAKELLAGRPVALVLGQVIGAMPFGWNAQKALSGGQIVEQSTHLVDAARYLAGTRLSDAPNATAPGRHSSVIIPHASLLHGAHVESVYARASTGHVPDRVDYEDSSAVTLAMTGGAVGTIVSTVAVAQFFWGVTVVARDLHLDLVYDAWTLRGTVDGQRIDEQLPVSGYPEQIAIFLDAVESGNASPVLCTYRDGMETLAATLAANCSLQSGLPEPLER